MHIGATMNLQSVYMKYVALRSEFTEMILRRFPGVNTEILLENALGGSLKFADAYVLWHYMQRHKPKQVLEVGSFLGFSCRWLLECGKDWGVGVTAVDPNIRHRIFNTPKSLLCEFNAAFLDRQLEVVTAFLGEFGQCVDWHYEQEIRNDPMFRDRLLDARPVIGPDWGRTFDFIFIDGDHEYDSARNNFEICRRLLRPGGVIALHDAVTWPGVRRFMEELQDRYGDTAQVETIVAKYVFDHPVVAAECVRDIDGIGIFCGEPASGPQDAARSE
jgi:predicted O-methyltransferase YrrM